MNKIIKIYEEDSMTAEERLASVVRLEQPDRVPLSLFIYHYAPVFLKSSMRNYINDTSEYMRVSRQLYEELGPWDIYYNTNPYSRFIYSTLLMMRLLYPGKELDEDKVPLIDEIQYMNEDDYDWVIKMPRLFNIAFFRARMLPRFCREAEGLGFIRTILRMWNHAVRQILYSRKDMQWWKERGLVVQIGMNPEMPFDTFSMARDVIHFSMDIMRNPLKVRDAALSLSESFADEAIIISRLMGVPRVQCFCHRTSNSFISPKQFEELAFPSMEIIVNRLVKAGITPILHCDGDWLKNLKVMRRLPAGKCIIQLDGLTDIFKAKEEIGDHMCIFGDVPASMLAASSPQAVDEYCHRLIEEVGRGGGFILGAGCEIPTNAKEENMRAMIRSVYRYGYYSLKKTERSVA